MPAKDVTLSSVAAVRPDDAWAVGGSLLAHWDGAGWTVLPHVPGLSSARLAIPGSLESISAAGPRNIWATGWRYIGYENYSPLLLHWDGHAWQRQSVPWAGSAEDQNAGHVVASGSSAAWFVWGNRIGYWNGARWKTVPPPFGRLDDVAAFSATGWNDVWAVGSYATRAASHSLAAHWDGSAWTVMRVPEPLGSRYAVLSHVVARAPGDVWAVGDATDSEFRRYQGFIVHWNGSRWSPSPVPNPTDIEAGQITAAPDGTAWMQTVCSSGDDNELLRWNDSSWVIVRHPADMHPRGGWRPSFPRSSLPSCG